jgi:hypothetical protein
VLRFIFYCAEWHYAECQYAECRSTLKGLPEAKHSSLSRNWLQLEKEELLKIQKSFFFNFQKTEKM